MDLNPATGLPRLIIALRDGTSARVRPIRPEDQPLLVEGLSQMSPESRFARFGAGISSLTKSELRYLTELDLVNHVAWGATIEEEPAGAGRFIVTDTPGCAEVAVAVIDRFQRRGLGRRLFDALVASGRAVGLEKLTFSIQPSNRDVLKMLRGVDIEMDETDGVLIGSVDLADVGSVDLEDDYVKLLELYREAG